MVTSKKDDSILTAQIDYLKIGKLPLNLLKAENITLIGNLIQHTETELLKIPKFGDYCAGEVKSALRAYSLHLRGGFI